MHIWDIDRDWNRHRSSSPCHFLSPCYCRTLCIVGFLIAAQVCSDAYPAIFVLPYHRYPAASLFGFDPSVKMVGPFLSRSAFSISFFCSSTMMTAPSFSEAGVKMIFSVLPASPIAVSSFLPMADGARTSFLASLIASMIKQKKKMQRKQRQGHRAVEKKIGSTAEPCRESQRQRAEVPKIGQIGSHWS